MRGFALVLVVALVGGQLSCLRAGEFNCATGTQCVQGGIVGACESNGYCSFPDGTCASGSRFGDVSGPVTGQCVGEQGGDAGIDTPPGFFTIGGTVGGLSGSGLVLQNNGGDDLPRSTSGPFTFATPLATGQPYEVLVSLNPTSQICVVSNATGTVADAPVTDVAVTCGGSGSGTITCPPGTCTPGAEVCCLTDSNTGTCSTNGSCAAADAPVRCSDSDGCGGGVCCARIKISDGDLSETLCTPSAAECDEQANGTKRIEYWCDPGETTPCPNGLACSGATIPNYFKCQ